MVDSALYDLGKALATLAAEKLKEEYTLLVGVREEGEKLQRKLNMINSVLAGAEERALMEENIKCWLDLLKDVVYDIEDVLDDWTMEVKLANKGKPKDDDIDQNEIATGSDQKENKVCFSSCIPTTCSCFKPIKTACIPTPCSCFKPIKTACIPTRCSCFKPIKTVKNRHDIARRIEAINDRLDEINKLKNDYNLPSVRGSDQPVIPRRQGVSFGEVMQLDAQTIMKQEVIEALLQPAEGTDGGSRIQVISLVGMGGIGKTTIAKIVCNDDNVKSHFDKLIMWVCVSDSFSQMTVSKAILNSLGGNSGSEQLQQVLGEIHKFIEGKRFLLVLDDVWTENYGDWNGIMSSLSSCLPGSRVLVTTRNHRVARAMKTNVTVHVNELPEEECLSLFQHFAFSGRGESERHNLESIAQEMAKKCRGLALAAETLGRAMAFKSTKREWEGVLKSNLWNFEDEKKAGELPAALLLSYIDLPSPMIKRCFASCCVFQKDQVMSKRDLVWLWMGLGLLRSETGQMEIVGEDYFNILVARSFFKEIDDDDGVKMHDIIHDLAQFLMKNEVLLFSEDGEAVNELILNKGSAKIRYLTMVSRRSQLPTVGNDDDLKRLRMLGIEAPDCELPDVLSKLSCVRVLKIWSQKMNVVPSGSIGKLTHLRYVDFSWCSELKELPESICDLFCLQTLNILGCFQLKKLPKGMGKLVNLRHLYRESADQLPKGMKGLSSLQTLWGLDVRESQLDNNHELLGLGDLQNLNSLQGEFRLYGIKGGMIEVEEAEKAALQSKTGISCLGLSFVNDDDRADDDDEGVMNRRLKVLEALKPHKDLEALEIWNYRGQRFASWINGDWLHNVKKLELDFCQPSLLPPLGTLPSLESLEISNMGGVRSVGEEFLGIEESHLASSSSSSHPAFVALFPKLKTLKFVNLYRWETWADSKHDNNVQVTNIIIMPSLSTLEIIFCRKLKSLPHFFAAAPIKKLDIYACPLIGESITDLREEYPWVSNIPSVCIG